ncbi:hypothetical protein T439DRAFT_327427 [Meredithblackwellia eburnea MCA 4105]
MRGIFLKDSDSDDLLPFRQLATSTADHKLSHPPKDDSHSFSPRKSSIKRTIITTSFRTRFLYLLLALLLALVASPPLLFIHRRVIAHYDSSSASDPVNPQGTPVQLVYPQDGWTWQPVQNQLFPSEEQRTHEEMSARFERLGLARADLECAFEPADEDRFRHLRESLAPFDPPHSRERNTLIVPPPSSEELLTESSPSSPTTTSSKVDVSIATSSTSPKLLIALNLWNNEKVLPTLARTIIQLSYFLGKDNVMVSIFENGSTDRTPRALAELATVLDNVGIRHRILVDESKTDWEKVDRIAQLAIFRNIVTSPARSSPSPSSSTNNNNKFETILFLNDVFLCTRDALELLHQRKVQDASATCGLDFVSKNLKAFNRGPRTVFYDNWVTRSLSGRTIRPRFDLLRPFKNGINQLFSDPGEEPYKARFEKGLPLPVYSCWNGMIAVDARPFSGISLTGERVEPLLFRMGHSESGECTASECKLMAKDMWRRGFNRFAMIPTVRTTYDQSLFHDPSLVSLSQRKRSSTTASQERIAWSEVSAPESVTCWRWTRRTHIDFWWLAENEAPL